MEFKPRTHLALWSEIVGTFNGISSDNLSTHIEVNNILLSFPNESKEAETAQKNLKDCIPGSVVGILRTDISLEPIRIRVIKTKTVS